MTVSDAVNFILGYSELELVGVNCERFLTVAMRENLCVWAIRRVDACTLRFKCRTVDLKTVRAACEKSGADLTVTRLRGAPTVLRRYRLRWGFVAGACVFLALLFALSSFIWSVELTGVDDPGTRARVLRVLEENGFHVGAPTFTQDVQALKRAVMSELDEVAYVTVNLLGSKAQVTVRQSVKTPRVLDSDPCNLVAAADGQIVTAETYQGVPAVQKYDTVRAGQLLVGGIFDSKRIGFRLVHANARIEARVLETLETFVPYAQTVYTPTGQTRKHTYLMLFGRRFDLPGGKPYQTGTAEETYTDVHLTENLILPIGVGTVVYTEQTAQTATLTPEEAEARARAELDAREQMLMKNVAVEKKEVTVAAEADGVRCVYAYTVIRDIARQVRIGEEKV